jgi:multicomponent Na+:H+ antiporter subunit D
MSVLAVTPVLVPLVTVVATSLTQQQPATQQVLSYGGVLLFLACALALVGGAAWRPAGPGVFSVAGVPFGIEFLVDRTSAALVLITALMGAASLLFLASDADTQPRHPLLLPLLHGVLAGVGGSFATADLFNLYVWFEVMLICSVGLFALGGGPTSSTPPSSTSCSTCSAPCCCSWPWAWCTRVTGHLNYGAIAQAMPQLCPGAATLVLHGSAAGLPDQGRGLPAVCVAAGLVPQLAGAGAGAVCRGLLTKVGVYAVLRTLGDTIGVTPLACCTSCWAGWPRPPCCSGCSVRPTTGTCAASWPSTSSARSATSCWALPWPARPAMRPRCSTPCTTSW